MVVLLIYVQKFQWKLKKKFKKEIEKVKKFKLSTPGVVIDRKRIAAHTLNPGNSNICISWGDPHFTTFKGTKFDNYHLGDHLLVKSKKLTIEVRQRRWGAASVNTEFAAKINGILIEADRPEYFLLNKRERMHIKVGQVVLLKNGVKVERIQSDRWLLLSNKSGYADIQFNYNGGKLKVGTQRFQRRYINFIVKVPNPRNAKGFCAGQVIKRSRLFSKSYKPFYKSVQIKSIPKACKKAAKLRCLNRHISKGDLVGCVTDLCNGGLKAKNLKKFEKRVRHDKKRRFK